MIHRHDRRTLDDDGLSSPHTSSARDWEARNSESFVSNGRRMSRTEEGGEGRREQGGKTEGESEVEEMGGREQKKWENVKRDPGMGKEETKWKEGIGTDSRWAVPSGQPSKSAVRGEQMH